VKDDFVSLFADNRWADDHVLDACGKLSPEQYAAEPVPGWSSVQSSPPSSTSSAPPTTGFAASPGRKYPAP
jgi:hypothetical protein